MARTYLIKPILDHPYSTITHGKGVFLYDEKGQKYLDGSSGAVTANIGHSVQEIVQAMQDQAAKVSFVYRSQFTTEPAEKLAEKISQLTPGSLNWSFFVNSGSEAVETAMKIAVQHWEEKGRGTKKHFITRWMSYHGITMGALSASGHIQRRDIFESMLENYPLASPPYYYRDATGRTIDQCDDHYAAELERAILRIGADNIAAFIAEPIIGAAGGALTPSDQYYKKIKAVCDRYDILFIADEIMTGMGRTGKMFAMEHFGVIPDIMAIGKGMGAGYTPIAAAVASEEVMAPILNGTNTVLSGHTYSANPLSAATTLAIINYLEKNNLVQASAEKGAYLHEKVKEIAKTSQIIGDVRGKGLFVGIEFVQNKQTKQSFSKTTDVTNEVVAANYAEKLLVYPANSGQDGYNGDAIIIAPPLTITYEEIDLLLEKFTRALETVEEKLLEHSK